MIYYFTGTGNSLWAAKAIGQGIGECTENIMIHRDEEKVVCHDPVIGFVFPTYMMDLPWIVKEFLMKLNITSNCYTFVVMTSNHGKSGHSFKNLDRCLSLSRANLSAGFDLQMPGNCLVSTEEENTERLQNAPSHIQQIVQFVKARKTNFISDGSRPKKNFVSDSFFYGEHSLKRLTLIKDFEVTDNCNGCEICVSVCPLNNIQIIDGKASHGHECAACYACLHWCPQNAVRVDAPNIKDRPQYHHPEITSKEISETYRMKTE